MKRKRLLITSLLLTCLGSVCLVSFEADPLTKITQQLERWANEMPVEKVYLQMDKPYYAAGEDIWFKAYVVSGSEHRLSDSGIVNVDLIDNRGAIALSVKLPLDRGVADGDFALPDTLRQGRYIVRAYTNYMRNAGENYFFHKPVTIINTISRSKDIRMTETASNKIDLQFFPEGGTLVNNITSKVAFKTVGPNGLGTDVQGVVIDDKGQQLVHFSSTHLGMGYFEMTPMPGVNYRAKIIYANGLEDTFMLPRVLEEGYVLHITDENNENLQIKVTASAHLAGQPFILVAQNAGKIYYTGKSTPGDSGFSALLPKSRLPSGIVQFTLFSSSGEPLNERLIFIENHDQLDLAIGTDNPVYAPRQKVQLNISARNDHKPVAGNFSISVTDETRVPVNEADENNMMASLLLTSDLAGYVEQAAYYFNNPDDKTRADLDALMLTQGYRRFEWKRLLSGDLRAKTYLPEKSLQISGAVLTLAGKPAVNAKVTLFDLDSLKFTRETYTDDHGRFLFNHLTFDDSVRFIVQARTDKNRRNVDIRMDKIQLPSTSGARAMAVYDVDISDSLSVYAQSSKRLYAEQLKYGLGNHVISLREVHIRERKQALMYSSNLNGPGNADQIIEAKDLRSMPCVHLADCLQGRLVGVTFRGDIPYSTRDFRPMQVIVDGVYVDGSFLNTLNYNDIQAIEILRNIDLTAIYGGMGGSGVFLVTTKHGGEADDYPQPVYGRGITTWFPKGYYKARVFYSPRYDEQKTNKLLADLRTTIFWKPDLLTGSDGSATVEYFNAGSKGTYRIVVEGIADDGKIGRQVYRYVVR